MDISSIIINQMKMGKCTGPSNVTPYDLAILAQPVKDNVAFHFGSG
jgi:hypothetical protein